MPPALAKAFLICRSCGQQTEAAATLRIGADMRCAQCGGPLHSREPLILQCPSCHMSSKPVTIDLARERRCSHCNEPLVVQGAVRRKPTAQKRSDPEAATLNMGTQHTMAIGGELGRGNFGRYRIEREIARGGMGIVYLAVDPELGRQVALKVLLSGESEDEDEALQRFLREARACSKLRHPNIVTVHEAGEYDGRHYFTMDYIKGRELNDLIDTSDLRIMVEWLRECCLGLGFAHDQGVIHRDLKPGNIMIDEHGHALVMDFGLAKDLKATSFRSLDGSIMGTPAYMSPEQALGETAFIDHRADIYSIGAVLYECATKSAPFGGDSVYETLQMVIGSDPKPPIRVAPNIDRDLDTIIMTCLEKSADDRYACMEALAADLGAWLAGGPILARPIPPHRRWIRRLRREPGVAAILLAVPLLALAIWWFSGTSLLDRLENEIRSDDPARMVAALSVLGGSLQDHAIDDLARAQGLLVMMLNGHQSAAVEAAAYRVLTTHADPAGLAPSQALLLSERPTARQGPIIDYLLALHEADRLDKPAALLPSLAQLAASPEDEIARQATFALAEIGAQAATQPLIAIAESSSHQGAARRTAITELAELSRIGSPGMACLIRLLGDEDPQIVTMAERGLEHCRNKLSILSLYGRHEAGRKLVSGLSTLGSAVAARQQQEMALLAQMNQRSPEPWRRAVERLHGSDRDARRAAAYDLGQIDNPLAIDPLLDAIEDPDAIVRRAAAHSLCRLAQRHSVKTAAIRALLSASDAGIRGDAAGLLGTLTDTEAVADLSASLARETVPAVRLRMIIALGTIGSEAAREQLSALSASTDTDLALPALRALATLSTTDSAALTSLIAGLEHREARCRSEARRLLSECFGEDLGARPEPWHEARADQTPQAP